METTVPGKTAGELTAAEHIKITDATREDIAHKRKNTMEKKAAITLTKDIASRRQTALMKNEFMQWESAVNQHHEDKIKDDKNKEDGSGGSSVQTGTALPASTAVHAALGRKIGIEKKAAISLTKDIASRKQKAHMKKEFMQ